MIVKEYEHDKKDTKRVIRVIEDLRKLGILIDSREIAIKMHESTDNPQSFSWPLSSKNVLDITYNDTYYPRDGVRNFVFEPVKNTIAELSLNRESCRNFSPKHVEPEKIISCLRNAYSAEEHPIPSAGGLYPLRIYMIQTVDRSELPKGIYHFNHTNPSLVQINSEVDDTELRYIFGSETLLYNAPSIVVVAADLQRQNSKYANRGYRYSLLEAGHAAQNIHLTASELGLSTLEFGGFRDDGLAKTLDLSEYEKPLITVAIGYKEASVGSQEVQFDSELVKGPSGPVEWSHVDFNSNVAKLLCFYKATAKFRKPNSAYSDEGNLFSSGTAASPILAEIKASAEAYERYIAGQIRFDLIESAANLASGTWLSPNDVRPMSVAQRKQSPHIERFDPNKPIHWIKGNYASGAEVYVPIDLVFYPIDLSKIKRSLVAEVDSSGMAAHINADEAAKRALLELVERDAIMRTWFTKKAPDKINIAGLPIYYQKRAKFWNNLGMRYEVLDFSHDDIAIAGVIIRSSNGGYPYLVNGASASTVSFEEAVKKASQEAELGAAESIIAIQKPKKLTPDEVLSPADHATFYAYNDYANEIEWLWGGPLKDAPTVISGEIDIFTMYNPVTIRLTRPNDPLQVVRVIAPQLVPISFGYGKDIHLHSAIDRAEYKASTAPHFFA